MYLSTGQVIAVGTAFIAVAMVAGILGGFYGYEQADFICERLTGIDLFFARLGQIVTLLAGLAMLGGIAYFWFKNEPRGRRR